jgi:hypothetical protein
MDDETPTPNKKIKKFSLSPSPQNLEKKKIVRIDCVLNLFNACLKYLLWANTPS